MASKPRFQTGGPEMTPEFKLRRVQKVFTSNHHHAPVVAPPRFCHHTMSTSWPTASLSLPTTIKITNKATKIIAPLFIFIGLILVGALSLLYRAFKRPRRRRPTLPALTTTPNIPNFAHHVGTQNEEIEMDNLVIDISAGNIHPEGEQDISTVGLIM